MAITEQDLRQQLNVIAAQAAPPRFTIGEVAGQIRRRRVRNAWLASAGAALVLAAVITLPLALTARSHPDLQAAGTPIPTPAGPVTQPGPVAGPIPSPPPLDLKFAVTVNGLPPTVPPHHRPAGCASPSVPCLASPAPGFAVSPGQHLSIRVTVGVPGRARLDGLWVGITNGTMTSPARPGGPFGGVRPILVHVTGLNPGQHTTRFGWTMLARTPFGTVLLLSTSWTVAPTPTATQAGGQGRPADAEEGTDLIALYVTRR